MEYREVFNRGIYQYPDKIALVDGERRITWKQWGERQHRLGNALLGKGLKKGDRVGVLLLNCIEYFDAYAALAKTGMTLIAVNYRLNADAIGGLLAEAECKAVLVDMEFLAVLESQRHRLPQLKLIVTVGGEAPGLPTYERLLAESSVDEPWTTHADDDEAAVFYTTGTTGAPKGAVATRRITLNRLLLNTIVQEAKVDDIHLSAMPIFHIGAMHPLAYVMACATNVVLRNFTAEGFCRTVQAEKITTTFLTPSSLNTVLNLPGMRGYDLGTLRLMEFGAAPMPVESIRRAAEVLPKMGLLQAYGCSEGFALLYLSPAEHRQAFAAQGDAAKKIAAAGRPSVLSRVKVVREDGTDVAPGEVGEILLAGPCVMSGYLGRPEETAAAIRDGWYHTKDLATVDAEGYVYIVDRKNHMIITGGENVYPAQVENALYHHPKIAEVAVIGIPDPTWGEAVKAFVVLKPGETMTEREVIEFCIPRMANYAKPKFVQFVADLPHTAIGKLDKKELKQRYVSVPVGNG